MTPFTIHTEAEAIIGVFAGVNRVVLSARSALDSTSAPISLTLEETEELIKGLRLGATHLRMVAASPRKQVV